MRKAVGGQGCAQRRGIGVDSEGVCLIAQRLAYFIKHVLGDEDGDGRGDAERDGI
jgi:hypothetical protein